MPKITHRTPYGTTINVNYINNPAETCDLQHIIKCLDELYTKLFKWFGADPFDGYVLNFWDDQDREIPVNRQVCGADGVCYIEYGVGNFAALTWQDKERTDLNDNSMQFSDKNEYWENLISHEFWHLLAYKMGFDNPNDKVLPEWKKIAGSDAEQIAEYGRKLHGCGRVKNRPVSPWIQPENVKGVHDMLLLWFRISDFIKSIEAYQGKVTTIRHIYSDYDIKYYAIRFIAEYPFGKYEYYCDRIGWQEYFPKENQWKRIVWF